MLQDIAADDAMLADIMLLDGATNDRLQGEQNGLSGISQFELVYGIPNAHIVRAAFLHTSHFGSRFNDATRGAWYAAGDLETSIAEVAYHKARRLADIVVPELPQQKPDREVSEYDDWLADFHAAFHTLDPVEAYSDCLQPEPVPQCYAALAASGCPASRPALQRPHLPQRTASRRNLRRLLPAGARLSPSPGWPLSAPAQVAGRRIQDHSSINAPLEAAQYLSH